MRPTVSRKVPQMGTPAANPSPKPWFSNWMRFSWIRQEGSVMHSISKTFLSTLAAGTLLAGSVLAQDVAPAHTETVKRIVDSPSFKAAADALQKDHDRWISEVIKLTEIPAPPFKEQE